MCVAGADSPYRWPPQVNECTKAFASKAFLGSGAPNIVIFDITGAARRIVRRIELLDDWVEAEVRSDLTFQVWIDTSN